MALTISFAPDNYTSVNNEMLFVVDEATKAHDDVTYPDYRYVLDLYVDGDLIQRQKVRPRPDDRFGIFDISAALQPLMEYGLKATSITETYNVRLSYRVQLGEEYDNTLYTGLVNDSSDRTVFNSFKPRPFASPVTMAASILCSNAPSPANYHRDQVHHMIAFYSDVSGITDVTLTFKNSAGSTIGTQVIASAGFVPATARQIDIGTANVTKPAGTEYVLITGASGILNLRVDYLCESKFTAYTLAWLNKFGVYESQSFGLVSKKAIDIEKKTFQRLPYVISGGEPDYNQNGLFFGGKRQFSSIVKTRMNLTSHLLTDNEYTFLANLFISTDVYLYLSDIDAFIPVTIANTNYEYRTFKNSKLTPLEFSIEFSDDYNAQRL